MYAAVLIDRHVITSACDPSEVYIEIGLFVRFYCPFVKFAVILFFPFSSAISRSVHDQKGREWQAEKEGRWRAKE